MTHPYTALPPEAFWRPAIADRSMFDVDNLWQPKHRIPAHEGVATYGSCFSQRFGAALQRHGRSWVCTEQAPEGCTEEMARQYNYGIFSARTGNIYTTSLLDQWAAWATGELPPPDDVWVQDGRCFDPFRPNIEPGGFCTPQDVLRSRQQAIDSFRRSIQHARHLVFTMGLTEAWVDTESGLEYPMCPGTVAGRFDADRHRFRNHGFDEVRASLAAALKRMSTLNPSLRVVLTVSPVPLTATASGRHVLVATTHTKSILRAVAADLSSQPSVDYFPSYEMINSPPFAGVFFEPNKRNVNARGVDFVMQAFLGAMGDAAPAGPGVDPAAAMPHAGPKALRMQRRAGGGPGAGRRAQRQAEVCEEALLDAFKP